MVVLVFGCGRYVHEALASIRGQTFTNWQCAVIYSKDEYDDLIESGHLVDSRFISIETQLLPVCEARNLGLRTVSGDILVALDGDDLIRPAYLERLFALMNDQRVSIAYSGTEFIGIFTGVKKEIPYSPRLLAVRNMIVSSAMFRRSDFEYVGGYDKNMNSAFEDWELWLSIIKRGGKVAYIPDTLFVYRQRLGSRSRSITISDERRAKEYLFWKHRDFCWHSPLKPNY